MRKRRKKRKATEASSIVTQSLPFPDDNPSDHEAVKKGKKVGRRAKRRAKRQARQGGVTRGRARRQKRRESRLDRRQDRQGKRKNRRKSRQCKGSGPWTVGCPRATTIRTTTVIRRPLRVYPKPRPPRKPAEKYSVDSLNVSETTIVNSKFQPVEKSGISVFRPEVIAITDFSPIYKEPVREREFTPAGKLIELQNQALFLRRDTAVQLMANLEDWKKEEAEAAFSDIQIKLREELSRTERTIESFATYIDAIDSSKDFVDIRQIPTDAFDIPTFLPLQAFMERKMQFSKLRQQYFSDTKLYLQLCADFKAVMENYSFDLLNLNDTDRVADVDPIDIDNTYTTKDGFSFSVESIRSENIAENASDSTVFSAFLNSLPPDPDDRVKLLLTVLSKEYRISKNMNKTGVKNTLLNNFGQGQTGNPFDNIVGVPGDTIFDDVHGTNSLAALSVIPINDNSVVFPFERKYIDSEKSGKTYIPGASYFFDSILETQGQQFNTQPYVEYTNVLSKTVENVRSVVTELFDFKNERSRLSPESMSDSIMLSIRESMNGVRSTNSSGIDKDQAAILAIFKLANTDRPLKNMLFQFLLLTGIGTHTSEDVKTIFRQLGRELISTENLAKVREISNEATQLNSTRTNNKIRPYLDLLAEDIEERVLLLTHETSSVKRQDAIRATIPQVQTRTDLRFTADNIDVYTNNPNIKVFSLSRGSISTILMSNFVPRRTGSTNLIKEFMDLANEFTRAASLNGKEVHLVDDDTGRTRYNFISSSMQLLILFELLESFVTKYTFSEFLKTSRNNVVVIKIDSGSTNVIVENITDITKVGQTQTTANTTARRFGSFFSRRNIGNSSPSLQTSAFRSFAPSYRRFMSQNNSRLSRSGTASRLNSSTNLVASLLNVSGNSYHDNERQQVIDANVGSPLLGKRSIRRVSMSEIPEANFNIQLNEKRRTLISIRTKTSDEDQVIANFLHIFDVINQRFKTTKDIILSTFNTDSLTLFLSENSQEDLHIIQNPTQVRTASYIFNEHKSRIKNNVPIESDIGTAYESLMISDVIDRRTQNAFFSLMARPKFRAEHMADERMKLVSVGIPAGFSKQLSERITREEINKTSFALKQFDVIKMNVYRRDARFDDIVFKPKTFIFDLSLFPTELGLRNSNPRQNENFDRVLRRIALTDYETLGNPESLEVLQFLKDKRYDFLSAREKMQMLDNHVQSFLLDLYINYMTGMKIREDSFLIKDVIPGDTLNGKLETLVRNYITDIFGESIPNQNISTILNNPEADDDVKDILRLTTFGSSIFEPEVLRQRAIGAKLFDRVFHLPVAIDHYEIDFDLTTSTESGRLALEKNYVQKRIITTPDGRQIFRDNNKNDVIFSDFFIAIETDF